ncbi:MAG: fatty acid oxidation complex subunit alpha FadJ [Polyangiaceae bacterium]
MTDKALSVAVRPDGIAVVTFDVPGATMNTLRADFVAEFTRVVGEIAHNPDVRAAVLISGKRDSFIAGADIDMLEAIETAADAEAMVRRGHHAVAGLAKLDKPLVAAVHGPALGGGFEVALACNGRVLSDSPKTVLGLPEVQLGLLPGLSGLQRLAALTSLQVALDYGLTGKNMRPRQAKSLGVADDVVPAPILLEVAVELAKKLAAGERPKRRRKSRLSPEGLTKLALEDNPLGRSLLFKKAREAFRKKTGGHYPAPEHIVDLLERYAADGLEASQEQEAQSFATLVTSDVSKNLRSIFFATTALKKDNGVDDASVEPRDVKKVAVLGAGLMGAGIAYVSIDKGYQVRMKDRDQAAVGRGIGYVAGILDERVKRRRLERPGRAERMGRLSTTVDYRGMEDADLVIEAVFEDLALKQRVLREVEEACGADVIFASNTSSIPIAKIAEASSRPENVVGMHYFSPVHKMPLLEVIRTAKTADEVVATAVRVGKKQGKTVIVVNDGVGFYTSRALGPYMNEASYLLTEGVAVETIDRALTSFGWPVGPLTLVDEVGIDVAAHVGPIMLEAFGDRLLPPPTIERLVADGRKGRKNERGFYRYGGDEKRKKGKSGKEVDVTVYSVLGLEVPNADKPPVPMEEIRERCNLQFVNEAFHCFGEGILRSPRDGDIGAIFGLGFPPFLGGPFRYVDAQGPARVLERIERYEDRFGARWTPAPALVDLARHGRKSYG